MSRLTTLTTLLLFAVGCEELDLSPAMDDEDTGGGRDRGDDGDDDDEDDDDDDDRDGARNGAIPEAPAVRPALFELGQALAFDPILSGNRDIACLSCHPPDLATVDHLTLPAGVGGVTIPRNAPPLFNLHAQSTQFWDNAVREQGNRLITPAGDALTQEMEEVFEFGVVSAQAMFPVTSREEMRGEIGENELANLDDDDFEGIWDGVMARLRANAEYVALLEAAYPGTPVADMTFAHAANAIAGFEIAAFESRGSDYERSLRGEIDLTPEQQQGLEDFDAAGCDRCHSGAGLSDFDLHNTGLAQIGPGMGEGPTGREDRGGGDYRFRTPPLTNTTLTGPWGHAGQYDDLTRFVEHYRTPAADLRAYDPRREIDDSFFWNQHFTGSDDAIVDGLDRRLRGNNRRIDAASIVRFLQALEDPAARDLSWAVPASVPSGLPVAP